MPSPPLTRTTVCTSPPVPLPKPCSPAIASTCPPLTTKTVPSLTSGLGSLAVSAPVTLMVVLVLVKLSGMEEPPQEEVLCKALVLPAASLPLLSEPEESDLDLLVQAALLLGMSSPAATPTSDAVALLSPLNPPYYCVISCRAINGRLITHARSRAVRLTIVG